MPWGQGLLKSKSAPIPQHIYSIQVMCRQDAWQCRCVHAVGAIGKVVFDAHKIMSELPHCLRSLVAKELYSEMGRSVAMLSRLPRMLNTRGVRE